MKTRHLLSISDLSVQEIEFLLDATQKIKANPQEYATALQGRQLAMIFQKPSTRTRVSFEAGINQLGGSAIVLNSQDLQLKRGESLADTARTLSRYVDALMVRLFAHEDLLTLARYSSIPVINGLDNDFHPCQGLADAFTILERFGTLRGLRVAYVGDGNNVCHSLMIVASKLGMTMRVATPPAHAPRPDVVERCLEDCKLSGGHLELSHNPQRACAEASVVYTDAWISMHMEDEAQERIATFQPFQVNLDLMNAAVSDAIFMHCLPAHRGNEVTDDVIDSAASVVFEQAENRLHMQKAILLYLLQDAPRPVQGR